jgi:hypothetical protein
MDVMEIGCEVDGTGSGSCAEVDFGLSDVKHLCSAATTFIVRV